MAPRAKTLSLREQGFRPSSFPKLELCIHFKARAGGEETPDAGRGPDLPELFALVLAGDMKPKRSRIQNRASASNGLSAKSMRGKSTFTTSSTSSKSLTSRGKSSKRNP